MVKIPEFHEDRLGQRITPKSVVAAPNGKSALIIGRVTRLGAKMIILDDLEEKAYPVTGIRKYPSEVVVLDSMEETLMFLLSRGI